VSTKLQSLLKFNPFRPDVPGLGWCEATRHTFASQWVMAGGPIEKLKEMLGHCSVVMTERYSHLRPDLFSLRDLGTITVDFTANEAVPVPIGQPLGSASGTKGGNP
jgi:hypothetical protein